jgi:tetratricopeptide (TPR) repeat protein
LKYPKLIDSILGENSADNKVMAIISLEELNPFDNKENPNWDKIERLVVSKYGALGEERVWGIRMLYYAKVEDWTNFGKYYKLYFDRAIPKGRSFLHINNLSWPIFEHVNDTAVLETAIKTTQYDLEKFVGNDPESIDTHANLLYKRGKREEAVKWELKAVELSEKEKIFVETLEKMQKGIPTWQ